MDKPEESRYVLVLAKAFPPNLGGIETYSEQVAFAYARQGYRPLVITQFNGPIGSMTRTRAGAMIDVVNVGPGPQAFVFARILRKVLGMRRKQFVLVHATTWRVSVPALFAGMRPLIVTVHGREIMHTEGPLASVMKWALGHADRIGVISDYSLSQCSNKVPAMSRRSVVVWNGLSWPETQPVQGARRPGEPFKILTACRLTVQKNVAAAIEAVEILKNRGSEPVELRIAGDGPERDHLKDLARSRDIDDAVKFLGHVPRDEMPNLYSWADLFLHPQTHSHDPRDFESFCIAVADAMGFGLPIIVGREGAPSEYIRHGDNGWLVNGTDPAEIADLVARAAGSGELCRQMGDRAAVFAHKHFSWDRHVQTLTGADKLVQ